MGASSFHRVTSPPPVPSVEAVSSFHPLHHCSSRTPVRVERNLGGGLGHVPLPPPSLSARLPTLVYLVRGRKWALSGGHTHLCKWWWPARVISSEEKRPSCFDHVATYLQRWIKDAPAQGNARPGVWKEHDTGGMTSSTTDRSVCTGTWDPGPGTREGGCRAPPGAETAPPAGTKVFIRAVGYWGAGRGDSVPGLGPSHTCKKSLSGSRWWLILSSGANAWDSGRVLTVTLMMLSSPLGVKTP